MNSEINTESENLPLFDLSVEAYVARPAEFVYAIVSDLPRSHLWSEECTGGEWIEGEPGALGSVFRGHNARPDDVVAWAPVVRGSWTTTAVIVTHEPPHRFAWAMRTLSGRAQDSVWGFTLHTADGSTRLVHHFRMGAATEGIQKITAGMDEGERKRFFHEWGIKVKNDMTTTLGRLKKIIESD
ncbi:SRPBCC family protein [Streptomyces massasporeus]